MHKRISLLHIALITCTCIAQATDSQLVETVQEQKKSDTVTKQVYINEAGITKELADLILARQVLSAQYLHAQMGHSAPPAPLCQDACEERITSKLSPCVLHLKTKDIWALSSRKNKR